MSLRKDFIEKGRIIFLTIDSERLKALTRRGKQSTLLEFKYVTKTTMISLNQKDHEIHIAVVDVKSIELYTIVLYINNIMIGKFLAKGIKQMGVVEENLKVEIKLDMGKIFLVFKN